MLNGHAEEDVAASLVELAGQPALGHVELEERVARRERHARNVRRRSMPRRSGGASPGCAGSRRATFASWSMCRPSRGRPASPLIAVDRPKLAVGVGPFVPDRDAGLLQRAHVGLAAQEPEELVDDRLRVHLLRRQQRKSLGQREAHLVAEHRERARCRCGRSLRWPWSRTCRMKSRYWRIGGGSGRGVRVAGRRGGRRAGDGPGLRRNVNCSVSRAQCDSSARRPARSGARLRRRSDAPTESVRPPGASAASRRSSGRSSSGRATTTSTRTRW